MAKEATAQNLMGGSKNSPQGISNRSKAIVKRAQRTVAMPSNPPQASETKRSQADPEVSDHRNHSEVIHKDILELRRFLASSYRNKQMLKQNVLLILSRATKKDLQTTFKDEKQMLLRVAKQFKNEKVAENFVQICEQEMQNSEVNQNTVQAA